MSWPLFHYRAQTVHVVDGDTVDLDIDFGDRIHRIERCRLLGIDADEMHDPDPDVRVNALRARDVLAEYLAIGRIIFIKTNLDKDDKYGRLLVTIYTTEDAEKSLNRQMVEWNLAEPYIGFDRI